MSCVSQGISGDVNRDRGDDTEEAVLVKEDAPSSDDLKKKDADEAKEAADKDGPEAGDVVKKDGDKVEFTVYLLIRLLTN